MNETLTTTSVFLLGCLHSFEPGHGKTFLLAYSVGGQLNFRKISLLTFSLLISHFLVLSIISLIFNMLITEFKESLVHEFSHLIAPVFILIFGFFVFGRAMYEKNHHHSDDCGHQHGKIPKSKMESPITVGLLTGMLPCASSLAVVMMTGMNISFISILNFIFIYVLGIAFVLFSIVVTFNYTKNIFTQRFGNFSKRLNPELLSGSLIIFVGLFYLSHNWFGHSH